MHDLMTLPAPAQPRGFRNILLLQGMVGPFFCRVGSALRDAGFGVCKINFNGGDRLFWAGSPGGIDFTGSQADWPDFLTQVILQNQISDVVLFGDCRPLHRIAIAVCRNLRLPVHVFDEGYIRPDWITFELGGVNGHSQLPRDPDFYVSQARKLPPVTAPLPLPSSFRRRGTEAVTYAVACVLLRWRFPHWKTHRPWSPLHEGIGWLGRLSRHQAAARRSAAILTRLEAGCSPYMLFPLQLDSDAQIRVHSPFPNMESALRDVMRSFAEHARPPLRLVVKQHPLDNGLTNWRSLIEHLAATMGIEDRVDFIETGDIALIVKSASGLVTVNSTTGTLALANDIPVITLGHAVYDIPGITAQAGLDDFWNAPGLPDAAIFAAFRRVLIDRCLVPGGFFSEPALQLTVLGVAERLKTRYACQPEYSFGPAGVLPRPKTRLDLVTVP